MDALLQGVEVEPGTVGHRHDDLAVDDATRRKLGADRVDQLREVPVERALVAAGQQDLVAVAEHDAAEPVPFRFVEPAIALGHLVGRLGEHGSERWDDGQVHYPSLARRAAGLA